MALTSAQKKALQSAGYTISKSGTTVLKDGASIGGINDNGKYWAGSDKVMGILKGQGSTTKPASKPTTKPKAKPAAKDAMKGYRKDDVKTSKLDKTYSGRGDGAKEVAARKKAKSSATLIPAAGAASAAAARSRTSKTVGKPHNPKYTGKSAMPAGFQGQYNTNVAKPRGVKAPGISPIKAVRSLTKGGRRKSVNRPEDFNPFLN